MLSINLQRLTDKQPIMRYNESAWWLTLWKKSDEFGFLAQVQSQVLQQCLKDLDRAFSDGFDRKQPLKRMPRFKKKGSNDSFRFPQSVRVEGNRVFLPKIGLVRFRQSRPIEGLIRSATVSRRGKHWFVSILTAREIAEPIHQSSMVTGIDRGVVNLATLSDGSVFEGSKPLKRLAKKLAREQRKLARKTKFSNNWKKQRERITRLHIKIADARNDAIHKATTIISKNHAVIVLEDLRTKNMTASAKGSIDEPCTNVRQKAGLNRSILDMGWFEFYRQLEYKQRWRGGQVILINPRNTSRKCSACGFTDKVNRQTQAQFSCMACGHTENADVNAAKNILAAGYAVQACEGIGGYAPNEAGTRGAAMRPLPLAA
ncbi:putative transposase [Mariprofundus micogutta]|uniref:Putative transposase n=2 Tax=Mariprofundus micogutta TaxID=1921010 RepID=A0A1L8CNS6_9PROT|nr:putative transposase [Mariprofundus micogutta]